jgi:hypothetical protein
VNFLPLVGCLLEEVIEVFEEVIPHDEEDDLKLP